MISTPTVKSVWTHWTGLHYFDVAQERFPYALNVLKPISPGYNIFQYWFLLSFFSQLQRKSVYLFMFVHLSVPCYSDQTPQCY